MLKQVQRLLFFLPKTLNSKGHSETPTILELNTIKTLFPLDSIQTVLLLEYNIIGPQPQTGAPSTLSFDLSVKGDLPEDKDG